MEKVSIVVPVYNAGKYIGKCIESLINQTYDNLEIILVNDGSTDYSLDILREYENKDSRIVVINNDNHGVSYTRNCGIKNATGKYIMFIDSDDTIKNNTIWDNITLISEHDSDIVFSGFTYYMVDTGEVKENPAKEPFKGSKEEFLEKQFICTLEREMLNPPWNKLIKLSVIKDNNILFNENFCICEDMAFSMQLLDKCDKIVISDKQYYNYFVKSEGSLVFKFNDNYYEALSFYYDNAQKLISSNKNAYKTNKKALDTFFINLATLQVKIILGNKELTKKTKNKKISEITLDKRYLEGIKDCNMNIKKRVIVTLLKLKLYSVVGFIYKIIG